MFRSTRKHNTAILSHMLSLRARGRPSTNMRLLSVFLVCFVFFGSGLAWLPSPSVRQGPLHRTLTFQQVDQSSSGTGVDTLQLEGLGHDHEKIGQEMAVSVQRWLDAEWMPQEIHGQIGESCAKSYVACRGRDDADIMNIMTQVADDLTEVWFDKYDADAFVNAWDIANYVSDYLVQRSGNESCECSAEIH